MGRSTLSRALPARFGPPAGFGYPLGGLLPAQPRRPCFMPAALLGLALQRLLTLAVEFAFLQIRTDVAVKNPSAGPCKHGHTADSAASRLCPAKVPVARRRRVTPPPGSCLSWAFPLWGVSFGRLGRPFGRPPPAGLARLRSPARAACHSAYLSPTDRLHPLRPADQSRRTDPPCGGRGRKNPGEVPAPFHDSETEGDPRGLA
jgi:hypothetical protein